MDKATTYIHLLIECGFRAGMWLFFLWLDKKSPVVRHIDEDELWYYKYPSQPSLVPKMYLYALMVAVPATVYIVQYIYYHSEKHCVPSIVRSLYGLTLSYCINGIFTAAIKLSVGRPRPNFYLRCFPEGYGTDIDNCDGEYDGQMDGRKSFPSAHSSFAFNCMVYMSLHLYTMLNLTKSRFLKGIIVTTLYMMILTACLVGISRTVDYSHHYSDVVGGAIQGTLIALITEHLYATQDLVLEENIRKVLHLEK